MNKINNLLNIKINWCLFKHKWEYKTQIVKDFTLHRPYTLYTRQCQRCYKKQKAIGWGENVELSKAEKREIKLNKLGI